MRQARLLCGFFGEVGVEDNRRNLGKGDASVPTPLHTAPAPTRGMIIHLHLRRLFFKLWRDAGWAGFKGW
jgi:hypothetical protein